MHSRPCPTTVSRMKEKCQDYTALTMNVMLTVLVLSRISKATKAMRFRASFIDSKKLDPRGSVGADDKVFAAGDMHRGQSLVVWAIREGRQYAQAVDQFLMGSSVLLR